MVNIYLEYKSYIGYSNNIVKKLIILLAFILPYSAYCQEKYLVQTVQSQKEFNIERCGKITPFKVKDQKYVIRLRYDKNENKLFYAFYEPIYPPYEGKSLFNNMSKERLVSERGLRVKNLTIEEMLNSPISASKLFSTQLSHQQQWNNGVSWSFMEPYESDGENIPTLSFKKINK
jgi:hypothetical protein